jgi:hypothetical protein
MRTSRAFLLLLAFGVPASAHAQHHLLARATPAASESTLDPEVDVVEASAELGVAGVNPNYFHSEARTNGATGELWIASSMSLVAGSGDPISFVATNLDPASLIEETVQVEDLGDGEMRASLSVGGGAQVSVDGLGLGPLFQLQATLRLGPSCQAYFSQWFGAEGADPPEFTSSCDTFEEDSASFDGDTLVVNVGHLSAEMELVAQILVDVAYFGNDAASFQFDGDLRVQPTRAIATYASPSFLTQAPEAHSAASGLATLGVLAALRRRARCA